MQTVLDDMLDCKVTGPETLCEELISGVSISQSFTCRLDNLCCIAVKFGTYGRQNYGILTFRLQIEGEQYERVRLVENLNNLQDNQYHTFNFSPFKKSAGRNFIFSLEADCAQGRNVVLWKTIRTLYGTRLLNGRPVSGTVCFQSRCRIKSSSVSVINSEKKSYTVPIFRGVTVSQKFKIIKPIIDALSLDLDNYGSKSGTILVDFSEDGGDCLLKANIEAAQITNGSPLLLPVRTTKTQNKTFHLKILSEDGCSGNVVGVKIFEDKTASGQLKINNREAKGSVVFDVRGSDLEDSQQLSPRLNTDPQIVFHQPSKIAILKPHSNKTLTDSVDIITLNYNRADLLLRCYRSLSENTLYPNWRWHLCDNGSTDNSADLIGRFEDPRVTITKRPDNSLSFGQANNLIFESRVSGEYVLFLNNDVIVRQNWLSEMVSILRNDPGVGIVGSRLYYPNGTPQHLGIVFQKSRIPVNFSEYFMNPKVRNFSEVDRVYKAATAACLLMRKEDFQNIGGFPQGYDYGYEDVDICLNMHYALKKKIVVASGSTAVHEEAATTKRTKRGGRPSDVHFLLKRWPCEPDLHSHLSNFKNNVYYGPEAHNPEFSIITCVTNPKMWMENIVRPNRDYAQNLEHIPVFNFIDNLSLSTAYNRAASTARGKYLIYCHQDLRFHLGWFAKLKQAITNLPNNWGVIGVAGWSEDGKIKGGLRIPGGIWSNNEGEVQTADECFIVVRRGLKFDEKITEPHFYGVDICLSAIDQGYRNYCINLPVEHRESGAHPDTWVSSYHSALKKVKDKWQIRFPVIRTTTCQLRQGHTDIVGLKPPRKD